MATTPGSVPTNSYFRGKTPEPVIVHHLNEDNVPVPITAPVAAPAFDSGTSDSVDVDDTGAEVLAANADRRGFVIRNQGYPSSDNADVYWGFSNSVVVPSASAGSNRGQLLENGEVLSSSDLPNYTGPIHAVTATGEAAQVSVVEW